MRKSLLAAAVSLALASPAFAQAASTENFSAWLDRAIERDMVFPAALERSNANGIATVRFSVGGDGRPADVAIVRSSGHSTIDQAALRTIARLDLPAGAPAGPHFAVLQFGTAANAAQAEQLLAQLPAATAEARFAMRAQSRQQQARAGGAPAPATTVN